jgi:hypothetical protein
MVEYAGPFLSMAHGAGGPEWLSIEDVKPIRQNSDSLKLGAGARAS